jgi:hypothetical protein
VLTSGACVVTRTHVVLSAKTYPGKHEQVAPAGVAVQF